MNELNVGAVPSDSASVAGTVPVTVPGTDVLRKNVVGFIAGLPTPYSHCWKNCPALPGWTPRTRRARWAIRFASAMNWAALMVP